MHSTLDLCPIPDRNKMNIPLHKKSWELTVLIYILCLCLWKLCVLPSAFCEDRNCCWLSFFGSAASPDLCPDGPNCCLGICRFWKHQKRKWYITEKNISSRTYYDIPYSCYESKEWRVCNLNCLSNKRGSLLIFIQNFAPSRLSLQSLHIRKNKIIVNKKGFLLMVFVDFEPYINIYSILLIY